LKNLPLHVSVHIYDHLQEAHEQCFMPLLSWIPWTYLRYVLVQYAAVCHCGRLCVCAWSSCPGETWSSNF